MLCLPADRNLTTHELFFWVAPYNFLYRNPQAARSDSSVGWAVGAAHREPRGPSSESDL